MKTNKQPAERICLPMLENNYECALDVVDIFYTIQGEGPFAGRPAIFVRLAGCNLQCPVCDTDYTTNRKMMSVMDIIKKIQEVDQVQRIGENVGVGGLVVITGGEPFRQPIQTFCYNLLCHTWYTIQVETNGTIFKNHHSGTAPNTKDTIWDSNRLIVVVSPKVGAVNLRLQKYVRHLKYVVSADNIDPIDGLPNTTLGNSIRVARPWIEFSGTIYLQPLDEQDEEKNRRNTEAAVQSCMKHGYTLCTQLHKSLNLP